MTESQITVSALIFVSVTLILLLIGEKSERLSGSAYGLSQARRYYAQLNRTIQFSSAENNLKQHVLFRQKLDTTTKLLTDSFKRLCYNIQPQTQVYAILTVTVLWTLKTFQSV